MGTVPATTSVVTLEAQVEAHAAEMFALLQDPTIYEYIEDTPPVSLQWLSERFRRLETRRSPDGGELWLNWVIRHGEGELVGYVQATVGSDRHADIAYVVASRFWRRHLAHQACTLMLDLLHTAFAVHTAYAVTHEDNLRSQRLLSRLGFSRIASEAYPGASLASCETAWKKGLAHPADPRGPLRGIDA
jgi:RimJ/RimL family protein N-acetyltransferase